MDYANLFIQHVLGTYYMSGVMLGFGMQTSAYKHSTMQQEKLQSMQLIKSSMKNAMAENSVGLYCQTEEKKPNKLVM